METFTQLKPLAVNPHFQAQKEKCLRSLTDAMIDYPIVDLINRFNALPFCFTLQSCYGHFVYNGKDSLNFDPLPETGTIKIVEYRIAYVALCIANSVPGRDLLAVIEEIPAIDPQNIQFGCADWFWGQQTNSYVLQVEPNRFKHQDTAILDYPEALTTETVRHRFFTQLNNLLVEIDPRQTHTDTLLE